MKKLIYVTAPRIAAPSEIANIPLAFHGSMFKETEDLRSWFDVITTRIPSGHRREVNKALFWMKVGWYMAMRFGKETK